MCFQPPKEKAVEKTHAGLTTLFPGQKRRVSHLCKSGKEVRPRFGDKGGQLEQEGLTPVWLPGPLLLAFVSWHLVEKHALCITCPTVPVPREEWDESWWVSELSGCPASELRLPELRLEDSTPGEACTGLLRPSQAHINLQD